MAWSFSTERAESCGRCIVSLISLRGGSWRTRGRGMRGRASGLRSQTSSRTRHFRRSCARRAGRLCGSGTSSASEWSSSVTGGAGTAFGALDKRRAALRRPFAKPSKTEFPPIPAARPCAVILTRAVSWTQRVLVSRSALVFCSSAKPRPSSLLDSLLGVKTNPSVRHPLDREQPPRHQLIVARETSELASEINRRSHYAASSLPSSSAAWITVPYTSRHSRTLSSVTTTTSAQTWSPFSVRRSLTDSLITSSTDGSITRKSRSLCSPASPRAWDPKQDHLRVRRCGLQQPPASLSYDRLVEHTPTIAR